MTFAGNLASRPPYALPTLLPPPLPTDDFPLLQLVLDTDVAAVETLLKLPLLYRVNALVLVAALLVPLRSTIPPIIPHPPSLSLSRAKLVPEDRQLLDVVDALRTDACDALAEGDKPLGCDCDCCCCWPWPTAACCCCRC